MERKKPTLLNRWLQQNGVTQADFAQQCGVTLGYMHGLLHGQYCRIKIDLLEKICSATGLPMEAVVKDLLAVHAANMKMKAAS